METITSHLRPYKNQIGKLAVTFTVIYYSLGLLVCYGMYKEGNTCGHTTTPFLAGLIVAALGLRYSLLVGDDISFTICVISLVIHALYIIFYAFYSSNKRKDVGEPLLCAITVICILYAYAEMEKEEKVKYRFGLVITVALSIIMALPLRNLRVIIANEDSSYIPCVSVTISLIITLLWMAYSVAVSDTFLLIQNLCRAVLASAQVILCLKYPRRSGGVIPPTRSNNPGFNAGAEVRL